MCQATISNIKANNKYMSNYVDGMISSYQQYLDANNLYVWAKCKKLAYVEFFWVDSDGYDEDLIK